MNWSDHGHVSLQPGSHSWGVTNTTCRSTQTWAMMGPKVQNRGVRGVGIGISVAPD